MNMFTVQILQMLLHDGQAELSDILCRLAVTRRMFLYYQKQLNDFLEASGLPGTLLAEERLYLKGPEREAYMRLLEGLDPRAYYLEAGERRECMLLMIGITGKPLTLEDFVNVFHVSRRTLLSDVNTIKDSLQKQKIALLNWPKYGYYFQGDELHIRYQLFLAYHNRENLCIDRIKRQILTEELARQYPKLKADAFLEHLVRLLTESETCGKEHFVYFSVQDLAQTILLTLLRGKKQPILPLLDKKEISCTEGTEYLKKGLSRLEIELEPGEQQYLWLVLQSAKVSGSDISGCQELILELARDIQTEFKIVSGIDLFQNIEFFEMFLLHVRSMYYRTRYRIKTTSFYDHPEEVNPAFSHITKQVMEKISPKYNLLMDEAEIQFISYYFFCMEEQKLSSGEKPEEKVVIVCASGLGSSAYIRCQVSRLFEHAFTIQLSDLRNLDSVLDEHTRLIISTLKIEENQRKGIPFIKISTILTPQNRQELIDWLLRQEAYIQKNGAIRDILSIIKKYTVIQDHEKLFSRLNKYFRTDPLWKRDLTLRDILKPESVQIYDTAPGWQEGIRLAAQPLLKSGYIKEAYLTAILQTIEKHGPYCEIISGVLLAHAEPSGNVCCPVMSLALFQTPIWSESWKKHITAIFILGVIDHYSHASALAELVTALSKNETYRRLPQYKTPQELYQTLTEDP